MKGFMSVLMKIFLENYTAFYLCSSNKDCVLCHYIRDWNNSTMAPMLKWLLLHTISSINRCSYQMSASSNCGLYSLAKKELKYYTNYAVLNIMWGANCSYWYAVSLPFINLFKQIFKSSIISLQDCIFCAHVQRPFFQQSILEAAVGKISYGLMNYLKKSRYSCTGNKTLKSIK